VRTTCTLLVCSRKSHFRLNFNASCASPVEPDEASDDNELHRCASNVAGLLEVMLDPVARAIANAPVDDEPVTEEEAKALAEADEWLQHNKPIPHEQVLAELAITQEEIENYREPASSG
jgi:hypothetical protein